jgi:hypothetical protein
VTPNRIALSTVKCRLFYKRLMITAVKSSCCFVPFENAITVS